MTLFLEKNLLYSKHCTDITVPKKPLFTVILIFIIDPKKEEEGKIQALLHMVLYECLLEGLEDLIPL